MFYENRTMETIQELRIEHLEEAVRFISGQVFELRGVRSPMASMLARYRWLYVDNPRRRDDFIGWGLRTETGELVGTHLIAWQHYARAGTEARALVSTNSYVAAKHRGPKGLGLMLNMTRRPDADLSICTSANVSSGSVWKSMRGIEMPGAGWEYLIPVNWSAWGVAGLVRKAGSPFLKRVIDAGGRFLPSVRRRLARPGVFKVEELKPAEIPGADLTPLTDRWEPARDPDWMSWRYSAYPGTGVKMLRISRSGSGGDLFAGVRIAPRGFGRGLRQLVIMDLHGAPEPDGAAVVAAIAAHFAGKIDLVGVRLLAAVYWKDALAPLSRQRQLEFPTHWMLSRKLSLAADDWRPSYGDGDACM